MNNSKFWSGNNKNNLAMDKIKKNNKSGSNGKALIKGIGVTGVIIAVLAAIVFGAAYFYVIRPAYALMSSTKIVKEDASEIMEALSSRDLITLEEKLKKTEEDLEKIREQRDASFGWARDVRYFKADEFYADSDRFINAAYYGIDAMREAVEVAKPFADAAGLRVSEEQEIDEEEGLMEAFQTWVSIMPDVAGQMDGVIEKVAKIGKELEPVNTEKYPEEFNGIMIRDNIEFAKNTLADANQYGPDIKHALTIIPRVLAVNEPVKRYMIIMQNDKEIRPTGGFMTNYATFKIQDALLQSDFTSKDMYSVDLTLDIIDATYDFPDAPPAYTKYLKVERWYARDMNYSPDVKESMDQFLKFYNMAGRLNPAEVKPVDGIIMIDTQVVQELLEVTGPVTVNGITYTEENVVLELEKIASLALREQANRKRVLGDLMEAMLVNVFESEKNLWSKMIDKAVDLAVRKHIQGYIFDEEAQALLNKYGFGGAVLQEFDGDYSMIVSTNLGGDKTNWFTNKKVDHKLEKDGERWVRTVTLNYTYNQPEGDFTLFTKRFRDWVRVFAPAGSELISVEGTEDGNETLDELGKTVFTGYLELGPGESKQMVFKYYLPDNIVGEDSYTLDIQKQGGIEREVHTVTVNGKTEEVDLFRDTTYKTGL